MQPFQLRYSLQVLNHNAARVIVFSSKVLKTEGLSSLSEWLPLYLLYNVVLGIPYASTAWSKDIRLLTTALKASSILSFA